MDRKAIFRALGISFLPIIVYIVIESEYGPVPGMGAAFVWSLLEMAWIWLREHRLEKLLLMDVGLIAILGAVSIAFSNPFFFKLKPAIFEAVFLVIIGLSLWGGLPIIQKMTERQMKGAGLEVDYNQPQYRQMLSGMFAIMFFHVIAIVWAAYYASSEVWGFVSGGLLYIIMGIWLVGQFLPKFVRPVLWKIRYSNQEWFPVLQSENGTLMFYAPRAVVHKNKDWLHPVVHVNLFDHNNRWFLQRRAKNKDLFPGYWDVSVGGHVQKGESIYEAALREIREEIGLKIELPESAKFNYQIQLERERELVNVFLIKTDLKPEPNPAELDGGRFWTKKEIITAMDEEQFTPSFKAEFAFLRKNGFFK